LSYRPASTRSPTTAHANLIGVSEG